MATTPPASMAVPPQAAALMERVLVGGDLAKLSPQERLTFYRTLCESLGLNPLTEPFSYLVLNGKMRLYALKNATDQLRASRGISIQITARERHDDLYVVTAQARTPDGRQDESIGAVPIKALGGEALANALMKAETKAKRRVTLSICSLGMLDESEVETIQGAVKVDRAKAEPGALPTPAEPAEPVDVSHLVEVPEETETEPDPDPMDDPQALCDALRERLTAAPTLEALKLLWDDGVRPRQGRFTAEQHQSLVVAKDRAKVRLGAPMPAAWVRPHAQMRRAR